MKILAEEIIQIWNHVHLLYVDLGHGPAPVTTSLLLRSTVAGPRGLRGFPINRKSRYLFSIQHVKPTTPRGLPL